MDELLRYLTFIADSTRLLGQKNPEGYHYGSVAEYVLRNGRPMKSKPLSPEQLKFIRHLTRGGGFPIKQCFANSQQVRMSPEAEGRLAYFEGFATTGLLPVMHGWLVLDGEVVIDLTWRRRDAHNNWLKGRLERTRIFGEIPEKYAYMGLEIASSKEIRTQILRTKEWRCFLDDWENDYPLLRVPPAVKAA